MAKNDNNVQWITISLILLLVGGILLWKSGGLTFLLFILSTISEGGIGPKNPDVLAIISTPSEFKEYTWKEVTGEFNCPEPVGYDGKARYRHRTHRVQAANFYYTAKDAVPFFEKYKKELEGLGFRDVDILCGALVKYVAADHFTVEKGDTIIHCERLDKNRILVVCANKSDTDVLKNTMRSYMLKSFLLANGMDPLLNSTDPSWKPYSRWEYPKPDGYTHEIYLKHLIPEAYLALFCYSDKNAAEYFKNYRTKLKNSEFIESRIVNKIIPEINGTAEYFTFERNNTVVHAVLHDNDIIIVIAANRSEANFLNFS